MVRRTYKCSIVATLALVLCSHAANRPEMVHVSPGSFIMGWPQGIPSRPEHKVHVDAVFIDKYEVTQGAYRALMGENPSDTKRGLHEEPMMIDSSSIGDKYPVTRVSWFDAVRYCNARSTAEGLRPCYDVWKITGVRYLLSAYSRNCLPEKRIVSRMRKTVDGVHPIAVAHSPVPSLGSGSGTRFRFRA
jgi:hypothetical protein